MFIEYDFLSFLLGLPPFYIHSSLNKLLVTAWG